MGSGWSSLRQGADETALQSSVALHIPEKRSSARNSAAQTSVHESGPSPLSPGLGRKALRSSVVVQPSDEHSAERSAGLTSSQNSGPSPSRPGARLVALQSSTIVQIPKRHSASPAAARKSRRSTKVQGPKFGVFLKLPFELQEMIWRFSYEPRVIEMRFAKAYTSTQFDFVVQKVPAVLHVCHHVREQALKNYKLLFKHKQCRAPTYFNPQIDALHLRDSMSWEHIDYEQVSRTLSIMPDKDQIQRLSITNDSKALTQKPLILEFPKLKEVAVSFRLEKIWEGAHIGVCHRTGGCGPCFPSFDLLTFSGKTSDISLNEVAWSQGIVAALLSDVHNNVWGELDWQEPKFQYQALCAIPWSSSKLRCPYLRARKAKSQHDIRAAAAAK